MNDELSLPERIWATFLSVTMIAAICAIAFSMCGCVYKGAKVTEGTDLAIGINVPVSEGTLQLQALNYLSGFRLGVDRNAILRCDYTVSESNTYFGCVNTHVVKTMNTEVIPLGDSDTNSVAVAIQSPEQKTNAPVASESEREKDTK